MHAWEGKSGPAPTPDYGTLGPGSDATGPLHIVKSNQTRNVRVLALLISLFLAGLLVAGTGKTRAAWQQMAELLNLQGQPVRALPATLSGHDLAQLDRQSAQRQAEQLLEGAINHSEGANSQIASRLNGWRGRLNLTPRLNSLITTGLNSNDLRVRATTIEIDLAAVNVVKTSASLDRLERQAQAGPQQQRIWALWTLGLLGNRGIEPERVLAILTGHLQDPDPEVRHWSVEGLAYLGCNDAMAPLLQILHDDASPMVRESAARSLAVTGMFSEQQRRSVVPKLLDYADDGALDAATHAWVYHALRDITGQRFPDNPAPWRNWYAGAGQGPAS